MAQKKHYSLAIENIPSAIEEYFKANTSFEYEIANHTDKGLICKMTKGKSQGLLNLFFTKGQVSHSSQGRMADKAEDCWNYIVQTTSLPNSEHKTYTIHSVSEDDYNAYIECLDGLYTLTEVQTNDPNVARRHEVTGQYGAVVTMTYYTNGTLYLQGTLTSLYLTMIVETLSAISSTPETIVQEIVCCANTAPVLLSENLSDHIQNIAPISGSVLSKMIRSSIQLINSAKPVDDYNCFVHGVLVALDGVMSKKLVELHGAPFATFGTFFDSADGIHFLFKTNTADAYPALKTALERAETFLHDKRTATFHVDRAAIEATTTITFDMAVDILKEALIHINNICNNW